MDGRRRKAAATSPHPRGISYHITSGRRVNVARRRYLRVDCAAALSNDMFVALLLGLSPRVRPLVSFELTSPPCLKTFCSSSLAATHGAPRCASTQATSPKLPGVLQTAPRRVLNSILPLRMPRWYIGVRRGVGGRIWRIALGAAHHRGGGTTLPCTAQRAHLKRALRVAQTASDANYLMLVAEQIALLITATPGAARLRRFTTITCGAAGMGPAGRAGAAAQASSCK